MKKVCAYCGRKGLFLKVSKIGLCNRCHDIVVSSIKRNLEILQDSFRLIDESKNFNTRMGRIETAIDVCTKLNEEYWSKGIQFFEPDPNYAIERIKQERPKVIEDEINNRVQKHMNKAKDVKTTKAKVNNANKALDELDLFEREYKYFNEDKKNYIREYINQKEEIEPVLKKERYKKAVESLERVKESSKSGMIMNYTVQSVKDERVCSSCKEHDQYKNTVDKAEIGINYPPFHDGCRCFATHEIEGVKK